MHIRLSPLLGAACALALTAAAEAQSFGGAQRITGVGTCSAMATLPGQRHRFFVLEIAGRVRVVETGDVVRPAPLVDFAALSAGGNGAIGLVVDPRYPENGHIYVLHTARASGSIPAGVALARYTVSATDPNLADPSSRTVILMMPSGGQHTGGWIDFGPDGYLYISTGDRHDARTSQNPDDSGGKILRIDVGRDDFPADPLRNYAIPPGNPFAGARAGLDEIWALGLRNPFRCSFDRATGDIWIGDVGQTLREEISRLPSGVPGLNFGWPCFEGSARGPGDSRCSTDAGRYTPPVFELTRAQSNCIVGGLIYRGCANKIMRGRYVFANCSTSIIHSFDPSDPARTYYLHSGQISGSLGIYGFGEDADGEIYTLGSGGLNRLLPPADGAFTDCNRNGRPDACEIASGDAPDENADGLPDGCTRACPADFDASGQVSIGDVFFFLHRWFPRYSSADFNTDGNVSIQDLLDFITAYSRGCS